MIEAAERREAGIERALAGMAEWRVAEIVSERQRLGEVFVEREPAGERARDLRHFKCMGQPGPVMVAFVEHEDLGLVLEPAERGGMDDAVAVAAEGAAALAAGSAWSRPRLWRRIAGIERARRRSFHGLDLNGLKLGPAGN